MAARAPRLWRSAHFEVISNIVYTESVPSCPRRAYGQFSKLGSLSGSPIYEDSKILKGALTYPYSWFPVGEILKMIMLTFPIGFYDNKNVKLYPTRIQIHVKLHYVGQEAAWKSSPCGCPPDLRE